MAHQLLLFFVLMMAMVLEWIGSGWRSQDGKEKEGGLVGVRGADEWPAGYTVGWWPWRRKDE